MRKINAALWPGRYLVTIRYKLRLRPSDPPHRGGRHRFAFCAGRRTPLCEIPGPVSPSRSGPGRLWESPRRWPSRGVPIRNSMVGVISSARSAGPSSGKHLEIKSSATRTRERPGRPSIETPRPSSCAGRAVSHGTAGFQPSRMLTEPCSPLAKVTSALPSSSRNWTVQMTFSRGSSPLW